MIEPLLSSHSVDGNDHNQVNGGLGNWLGKLKSHYGKRYIGDTHKACRGLLLGAVNRLHPLAEAIWLVASAGLGSVTYLVIPLISPDWHVYQLPSINRSP